MQKETQFSAAVGKKVNASDRASSQRRQWVSPAIRKLKVDQTEGGVSGTLDGLAFS